jgi:hypothetical protein
VLMRRCPRASTNRATKCASLCALSETWMSVWSCTSGTHAHCTCSTYFLVGMCVCVCVCVCVYVCVCAMTPITYEIA